MYQRVPARRSVGVEEVEGTGFTHGELEVEAGHVRAVDGLEVDRQRYVAQTTLCDLADEREVGLGGFTEIDQGLVALLDQPVQTGRGGYAAGREFEIDRDEPGDAGRPSRG